jgi:hypothetical protein
MVAEPQTKYKIGSVIKFTEPNGEDNGTYTAFVDGNVFVLLYTGLNFRQAGAIMGIFFLLTTS